MSGLLVLLVIGFTLPERPVKKTGFLPFVTGLETVGGDFDGRPVLLALHHKRGRHSLGLTAAMAERAAGNVGHHSVARAGSILEPPGRRVAGQAIRRVAVASGSYWSARGIRSRL